jgi:hypothetical protein
MICWLIQANSMFFWICVFMNFHIVYHHYFHLRFLCLKFDYALWAKCCPTTKTRHRETKTEKKQGKIINKGACRELLIHKKLPTSEIRSKVDPKNPRSRTRIFLPEPTLGFNLRRTSKGWPLAFRKQ